MSSEGQNSLGDFSETTLLQRYSISWLSVLSAPQKTCMCNIRPRIMLSSLYISSAAHVARS